MTTKPRGSLGPLLGDPVPPAEEDAEFRAHQQRTGAGSEPPSAEMVPRPEGVPTHPAGRQPARPPARQWNVTDDEDGTLLAQVHAATQGEAVNAAMEATNLRGGFSVWPADMPPPPLPAHMPPPRPRSRRKPPSGKLTVQVSESVLVALEALVNRDGNTKYMEVEAALRFHLAKKNVTVYDV